MLDRVVRSCFAGTRSTAVRLPEACLWATIPRLGSARSYPHSRLRRAADRLRGGPDAPRNRKIVGVTRMHGQRAEPRWVEDLFSRSQVAGIGWLPYLMEEESARAVEQGQPSQWGKAAKAERLVVASTA